MTKLTKAFFFSFNGKDILKAHLFEHCLGAYFLDHDLPLFKVRMHPLGVCALFDGGVPEFPNVSDLEPYIENQKKRMNIELLAALDTRELMIERLHQLQTESFDDAVTKIEDVLSWDNQSILKDFERIYRTKVEAVDVSATLPKISTNNGFRPTKHKISVPKLNPRLDAVGIAIRVPQTTENLACLMRAELHVKKGLEKLTILGGIVHGLCHHIITLAGGYSYFTYSPKTRAGQGRRVIDSLLSLLRNIKFEEESFKHWKKKMVRQAKENWEENTLTSLLVTELILWRRILKPEDFENLTYQTMSNLHKKTFPKSSNIYLLTDF